MCQQGTAQPTELEAFCTTCPPTEEVSALLATLGFTLAFHMDAVQSPCAEVPPLPAQYHYKKDECGTEVIYLAGRDTPLAWRGKYSPSMPAASGSPLARMPRRSNSPCLPWPFAISSPGVLPASTPHTRRSPNRCLIQPRFRESQ